MNTIAFNNAAPNLEWISQTDESQSPLALMHPRGRARHTRLFGSNCPPVLLPDRQSPSGPSTQSDLIIVAPTIAELGQAGWLAGVLQQLPDDLEHQGLLYLLLPPRWRHHALRLLCQRGFVLDQALLHVPHVQSSRYLVPLRSGPLHYAFSQLIPLSRPKQLLIGGTLQLPTSHILARLLPAVGLVMRQPGTPELFDWWPRNEQHKAHQEGVILTLSWRGKQGGVTCHHIASTGRPTAVAKVSLTASATHQRAADFTNLVRFGAVARAAGVAIPQPLQRLAVADQQIFVQSALAGSPAVARLMTSRRTLVSLLDRLVGWLIHWQAATRVEQPLSPEQLQRWWLFPAAQLASRWAGATKYQCWLETQITPLLGTPIPLVATHNDLTMWNVLMAEKGELGIVDWEAAQPDGLPLTDFFYTVTDAVAATSGYRSRLGALQACFATDGMYAPRVTAWQLRQQAELGLGTELLTYAFHACWLHHARNEAATTAVGDPQPFLEVVQWLATHPRLFSQTFNA